MQKQLNIIKNAKNDAMLLSILLFVAFIVRFTAAVNMPLVHNESSNILISENIRLDSMGQEVAFLTTFLLTFDQFHSGETSLIREEALLLFFASAAIYCFFKALNFNKNWIYCSAMSIGIDHFIVCANRLEQKT